MTDRHTQGPWFVREDSDLFVNSASISKETLIHSGGDFVIARIGGDVKDPKANARLIALAPEMVDTLKDILADHDQRRFIYGQLETQENRVKVMGKARALLSRINPIKEPSDEAA